MNIIVTDNDIAIHYEVSGRGYPLIMLHGQYMNTTMFDDFETTLKEDYQLVKIDLRGHGYSDKPFKITIEDYMQDVLSVMDELMIKQAHFLGYGLGGIVAELIAANYPEMIQRLVLICVGSEPFNVSQEKFYGQYSNILRTMKPDKRDKMMEQYMYCDVKKVKKWKKALRDTEKGTTKLERHAIDHSADDIDLMITAHQVTAPTLIINGAHDELIKPDNGYQLSQKIPNGYHLVYENSGHAPMIEEKERFLEDVQKFLSTETQF
ncbi:alpha/beta fold hydrolase [Macrococcus carouselicus]|uniref:Alpha/beta hydrolase n=1 Tax=Macrococcus carouselicus TaxID=69969 RepID=A0A9Q8CHY2_9STAP|nr:alpha/beta hydrolase [Macrococcus carouselicus]TDM00815.1 alpha/beta hydrolase [Macrococcus carouselicus]